jgi:PPM family protein phosphatase
MKIEKSYCTHIGRRNNNEDSVGAWVFRQNENLFFAIAVADGMGGHAAGEVASRIALKYVERAITSWITEGVFGNPDYLKGHIKALYEDINAQIGLEQKDPEKTGMGTTLVMAVGVNNHILFSNIGDSRAYIIYNNKIVQISEDHSVVAESLHKGLITADEMEHHPYKNALTRSVDGSPSIQVDFFPVQEPLYRLHDGVIVFVCSDGLSGVLKDPTIHNIFSRTKSLDDGCRCAVEKAFQNGGQDNISIAAIEFGVFNREALPVPVDASSTRKRKKFLYAISIVLSFILILLAFFILTRIDTSAPEASFFPNTLEKESPEHIIQTAAGEKRPTTLLRQQLFTNGVRSESGDQDNIIGASRLVWGQTNNGQFITLYFSSIENYQGRIESDSLILKELFKKIGLKVKVNAFADTQGIAYKVVIPVLNNAKRP